MPDLNAQNLIEFVVQRGSVSFVDIEDYFGAQAVGDAALYYGQLAIWAEMSDRLIDALNETGEALTMDYGRPLFLAYGERRLNLPLVPDGQIDRCLAGKNPREYWAPAILRRRRPDEMEAEQ